jgi:hypothetical protein
MGREKRRRQKYNEFLKDREKKLEARRQEKQEWRESKVKLKEAEATLGKMCLDKEEDWESDSMEVEKQAPRVKSIRKKKAFIKVQKKKERKRRKAEDW